MKNKDEYLDFLPIKLSKDSKETDFIPLTGYFRVAMLWRVTNIVGIKLMNAREGLIEKKFHKIKNNTPFLVDGFSHIKIKYGDIKEDKEISLLFIE